MPDQAENRSVIQILGASVPRSGHHLLMRGIRKILGPRLYYCEPYVRGCCNTLPCTRRTAWFYFKKSHDFRLTDEATGDYPYVIQFRDFVFSTLSYAEVKHKHDRTFGSAAHEVETFFASQAAYFVGFMRKWYKPKKPNYYILDYDDLTADTPKALREVLRLYGVEIDAAIVEKTATETRSVDGRAITYKARSLEDSHYYNQEMLELYESIVLAQLPFLENKRKLTRIERFEDTPSYLAVMGFMRQLENDNLAASDYFARAYRLSGVSYYRALADARLGDYYWRHKKHGRARKYYLKAVSHGVRRPYISKRLG